MNKVPFNDVVPPDKRSIRNIQINKVARKKSPVIIKPESDFVDAGTPKETQSPVAAKISDLEMKEVRKNPAYEYYYPKGDKNDSSDSFDKPNSSNSDPKNNSKRKRFLFSVAIVVIVGTFLVLMMTMFSSASVLITPKSQVVPVAMDVQAIRGGKNDDVVYELIKLSRKETVSVSPTGEENAEIKARGKIVVYNNFSSESQRLIARTRFESPEGLVYRIPESIVVPGRSTKNGVSTPGSIEVEVFADEPGEKYNIKKTDFTIPGFKNDPERYKAFYARSSTDMTGGFIGKLKTVLPEEKEKALSVAESQAREMLDKDLVAKIPDGYTLLSGAVSYESSELPQSEASSGVLVGKEVTAYALILNSSQLSKKIVTEYSDEIPGWINIPSSIQDFSGVSLKNSISKDAVEAGESLTLTIGGEAGFVADIDADVIKTRLVGSKKAQVSEIIDEFEGISSIKVTLRPIWKRSFPGDASKISVFLEE
ncbi:MAG TPA: hypothetical protein VJB58_00280 [Candidatus Paceibacterota bacterium]